MGVFEMFPHLGLQEMEKKGRDNPLLAAAFQCSLTLFGSIWSGVWDSNVWECGPKPMSEPSDRPLAPSLALSGTPAVPLWNSFALFVSDAAFVFWDLCGMKFCILKVLPTGFTPASGDSITENTSEIAPHKQ